MGAAPCGHFAALPLVRSIASQSARRSLATATRLIRYAHSANLIAYGDRRISLGGYEIVGGLDVHGDVRPVRAPSRKAQPMMAAIMVAAIATIQSVKQGYRHNH